MPEPTPNRGFALPLRVDPRGSIAAATGTDAVRLEGERAAVQKLWESYFLRLVRQTQRWLRRPMQAVDAEDIALSAFDSFCRRAEQGRFPKLFDRNDLWQLLVVIAFRKACNQVKHEARQQPRNGRVLHASVLAPAEADDARSIFSSLIDRE